MKRFALAMSFACLFSISALAGQIPCDVASPTPESTAPGEIPSTGLTQADEAFVAGFLAVFGFLS